MSNAESTSLPLDERLPTHRVGTVVAVLILSVIVGYFSRSETDGTIRIWLMHAQVPCEHITSGTACGEKAHWTYDCNGRMAIEDRNESWDQAFAHLCAIRDLADEGSTNVMQPRKNSMSIPVEIVVLPTTSVNQATRMIEFVASVGFPNISYRLAMGDFPFGERTVVWPLPRGREGSPKTLFELRVTSTALTAGPLDAIDGEPLREGSDVRLIARRAMAARGIPSDVIDDRELVGDAMKPVILASPSASWIRVLARYRELERLGYAPIAHGFWK